MRANSDSISSRAMKRVSGKGVRLVGMAATCPHTCSISGRRLPTYSKNVCSAARRWLRVGTPLWRVCSSSNAGPSAEEGSRGRSRRQWNRRSLSSWPHLRTCWRRRKPFEATAGFLEELAGDSEIDRGSLRPHMPQEGRHEIEPSAGIQSIAIPAQQCPHGERMSQPVHTRTVAPSRDIESQSWQEMIAEVIADGVGADRALAVPGEQRCAPRSRPPLVRAKLKI